MQAVYYSFPYKCLSPAEHSELTHTIQTRLHIAKFDHSTHFIFTYNNTQTKSCRKAGLCAETYQFSIWGCAFFFQSLLLHPHTHTHTHTKSQNARTSLSRCSKDRGMLLHFVLLSCPIFFISLKKAAAFKCDTLIITVSVCGCVQVCARIKMHIHSAKAEHCWWSFLFMYACSNRKKWHMKSCITFYISSTHLSCSKRGRIFLINCYSSSIQPLA